MLGTIRQVLPGSEYLVSIKVKDEERIIKGYISGRMRRNYIRLLEGDKVDIEITPYDISKCRIVYRHNKAGQPENPPAANLVKAA